MRGLSRNFKGVSQLKLVNETITSKTYQENIKSDIKLQYECTLPQAFKKITHLEIALENIHAFTRDQGGDIFELPPYSVDLTSIDTDCSIVKRHVSRMSNIKDRHFKKLLSNFVHLEFR